MSLISFEPNRPLDLIGLGRLCIDLNANEIHRPMEETLSFTKYLGGSPANIAVASARLGLRTGFIGKVSNDPFGRFIMKYLEDTGINTENIHTDRTGAVTGLAFTEIKSPTECSILMYRDNVADLKLEPSEVSEDYIASAKAILISGTALAKSPSREAVFVALEYAKKHNVVTLFDIDYRPWTWQSKTETGVYCRLVAEKCDVIVGGRDEFDLMEAVVGPQRQDDRWTADHWLGKGASVIVVKRGGDGSTAYTKDGGEFKGSTFPAQVVKTFGAGDSFAGAFIYGLMNGWDIPRCQEFGAASASIVVSSHSCSDAMPTAEQIQARIDRFRAEGI
ncbi:5-dehydro-2-deoxygluconokinase [Paenibacillus sp.]|uniref:5-dehydro-2-deoxygluconokinase n=1 Tax=Paenibacillus sp. TaxID=58172 RepID=UPI00281114CB|nr:5-dehydro-2-deoxygluconokinase [Paenibacillus sp.]